jgi:hypothetical protein
MSAAPNAQAHLDAAQGAAPQNQNVIVKRTLSVHIVGSLSNLALAGPQAAMWKPLAGKETELFCPSLEGEMDPAEQTNSIRNGLVRSMTIVEQQSTFPCTLGVSVSCIPPSEVTEMGDKYAFTVLPSSRIASPQTVYVSDSSMQENLAWRQQYGKWNKSNLESEGVLDVPGQPYVFVHMDHPSIGLLRHNQDIIGCDVDKMPKIDGRLFKLSRQILASCCNTLRTKILSKMLTQDMNMFSLQLHRIGAETWDDFGDGTTALQGFRVKSKWSPEDVEREKEHHLRQFATTPYHYIARLQLEYEVPAAASQGA